MQTCRSTSLLNKPAPYILHPAPYTLHPTPCTLHPTSYALHHTPYILHPTPYTLHLHHTPRVVLQAHGVLYAHNMLQGYLAHKKHHPPPRTATGP